MRIQKLKGLTVLIVLLLVSACAVKENLAARGIGSEKIEVSGVLLIYDAKKCTNGAGCEYVLLDKSFDNPVPLLGEIDAGHNELVLSLEGRQIKLSEKQALRLNHPPGADAIKVKRYRTLSSIAYRDLLLNQSTTDSKQYFGCNVLWDKKLSWQLHGEQVVLVVRMIDSLSKRAVKPYVELRYDGNSAQVLAAERSSPDVNPC